ncbi:MAG: methyltransferase domain-containing protein [Alphaproteobacteria bacterium]|nr:methyltransferase domain-containing protein [Alphaproteobacteria bacterium]
MNTATVDLPASLRAIATGIRERGVRTPRALKRLVEEAGVQQDDLLPWADFEHPAADSYGRQMVLEGEDFEIMVMSWAPGDCSAIHDHGHTRWGAVQVFGPAEHATFLAQDGAVRTLDRRRVVPGTVLAVGHQLVHQMGNPSEERFLTLHVYGCEGHPGSITGDARLFALTEGCIQRTTGGAFFGLPEAQVDRREEGLCPDYPTWLRHHVELVRRTRRAEAAGERMERPSGPLVERLFDPDQLRWLREELEEAVDAQGQLLDAGYWRVLFQELREAAALQRVLLADGDPRRWGQEVARHYDAAVSGPALQDFVARYIHFVVAHMGLDLAASGLFSLGCGTGLVERHVTERYGVPAGRVYGIDISPDMLEVAARRIRAELGDLQQLTPEVATWKVVYSGLCAMQYANERRMAEVIENIAAVIEPGGVFFGDFVAPDFIRRFSHLHASDGGWALTLRMPELVVRENRSYLRSHRLRAYVAEGRFEVIDDGAQDRYLPPMMRVRAHFERAFAEVELRDAVSLELLERDADTCRSGRYLVLARRG